MILSGNSIKKLALQGMIEPFVDHKEIQNGMSYGLSVASYDLRCGVEPWTYIKKGDFALSHTLEKVKLPNNIAAQILDKSSWARKGISLFNTWIDPGFEGHITLELQSNHDFAQYIGKGDPICQIVFFKVDEDTEGYQGKYQHQGPQPVESVFERGAWGERIKRSDDEYPMNLEMRQRNYKYYNGDTHFERD